jgi:transmembrane E3 ubiquitin-protein ligase
VKFVGFSLFTLRMLMSVLRAGTNNHAETRTAVGDQADAALAVGDTTSSRSVAFRVALVHIVRRVGNFVAGADQERSSERLDAGQVYCRFYLVLFGVALLAWLLGDYGVRVVVLLLGFGWGWPQIGNNAWRDTTTHKSSGPSDAAHALTTQSCFDTRYAMMAMVARSFVPLYMWACPRNVANVQVSPGFSLALLLWVAAQLVVWRCQEMFGPRFFLPAFLLPPKYNYQRQLPARLRHDQDGMAAGSVDLESGNATMGDCVICMSPVVAPDDFVGNGAEHVNVNEGGNHDHDSDAEESDGRYAIAPCDHLFHARCLERWMERKMECPTCRRALPDL